MNLIISGCTCSGKTTLANRIKNELDSCVLEEDLYFKNLNDIPRSKGYYLMDSPNAFNIDEYLSDASSLISDGSVLIPSYDVSHNTRTSKSEILKRKKLIIFEGLHTISILKSLTDSLNVFMDTDLEECLERRIRRDKELYGINELDVRKYFNEVILPLYKSYIEPQKKYADILIKEGSDEECLLHRLKKHY